MCLTYRDNESHAEELPSQSSLDLVQEVLVGGPQVPEDQPELGQGPVEDVVVVEHHLVVVVLAVLSTCAGKE